LWRGGKILPSQNIKRKLILLAWRQTQYYSDKHSCILCNLTYCWYI
jgi:hypothetical protein